MAHSTYESALARLLAHEGGYTDHPDDPGGPTNFGITIADYRRYAKADATAADVRAMSGDEAKAIYRKRYWDAQRCDDLPAGVDYAVFDYGVNSGIGRAGKVLRRMLHLPDNTGAVTADVVAAARAVDARALVTAICDERLTFLKSLKTSAVFGRGWGRRVDEVKTVALQLAPGAPPAIRPETPHVQAPGKGQVPAATPAVHAVAAAAGAAAAAAAANAGGLSAHAVAGLVLFAAVAAAAATCVLDRSRQSRRQNAATPGAVTVSVTS